jgi:hypothetical protein
MSKKKLLTDALTLALATGSLEPVEVPVVLVVPEAVATPPADAPPVEPTPAVLSAVLTAEPVDGLAAYLKSELATVKTTLAEAQQANIALQAQVATYAADNVPGMKVALTSVINRLSVPLNAVLVGVENFNGAQLVGAFDTLNAKLSASFSPGAKASTAAHDPSVKTPTTVVPTPANVNPLTSAARISTPKE